MHPEANCRVPRLRPESEWIVTERPDLRIISQKLWDRVQQRRKAQAQSNQGHIGRGPKYLLSGLFKCDECDSNFAVSDYCCYSCGRHLNQRMPVCTKDLRASRKLFEECCLASLRDELLTPEELVLFIKENTRQNRDHQPEFGASTPAAYQGRGRDFQHRESHQGRHSDCDTKMELEQAERERARLQDALKTQATKADKVAILFPQVTATTPW